MLCERCSLEIKDTRTTTQNRALHKYFDLLSEALNDAGMDMRETIREDVDIPWTPDTVKNYLWRPLQKAYLKKQSTTTLTKKEVNKLYDILNKIIGERTGVSVPFPSIENMIDYDNEQQINKLSS